MTLTNVLLLWLLLSITCTILGTILTIRRTTRRIAWLACWRCGAAREPGACCCGACGQRLRGVALRLRLLLAKEGGR